VRSRTPAILLITALAVAALAAPAAAAQGAEEVPPRMWDSAPAETAAHDGSSSGGAGIVVVLSLIAAATAAGFAFGEVLPLKVRARVARTRARRPARPRGPRSEGCAIVVERTGSQAEFRVMAGHGETRDVLRRSRPFDAPRTGSIPDGGAARAVYDGLMAQLRDEGWQVVGPEPGPSAWYRVQLVRARREALAA
jgi:hypothetical protein